MAVDKPSRGAMWAEQRSRAARRRRWLTAAALLLVGTCGVEDCYVREVRDFHPVTQASAFGAATLALYGGRTWTEGGTRSIRGNPYLLVVRVEPADRSVIGIELLSLTLRGVEDGKPISFSGSATRKPDESSAAIALGGVNVRYQDYSVSGTLRIRTTRGTHDVPLGGTLRRSFSRSRQSKFMDRF
jgi:hypothetical protein